MSLDNSKLNLDGEAGVLIIQFKGQDYPMDTWLLSDEIDLLLEKHQGKEGVHWSHGFYPDFVAVLLRLGLPECSVYQAEKIRAKVFDEVQRLKKNSAASASLPAFTEPTFSPSLPGNG